MITTDNSQTFMNAIVEIQRLTSERDAAQAANKDLQAGYDVAIADAKRYQFRRALYIRKHPEWTPEQLDAETDKAITALNEELK